MLTGLNHFLKNSPSALYFCAWNVFSPVLRVRATSSSPLSLKAHSTGFFTSWWDCSWIISCVWLFSCSADDFVVQKPELSTPSICHAPGGEYFVEGETWHIDTCTQCTCHSGRVLCETEVCPPLLCQNPTRTQDSCCPQCPGNRRCVTGRARATVRASSSCKTSGPGGAPGGNMPGPVTSIPDRSDLGSRLPEFTPFCRAHVYAICQVCFAPEVTVNNNRKLFLPFFPLTLNLRLKRESCCTKLFQMILLLWSHLCHYKMWRAVIDKECKIIWET